MLSEPLGAVAELVTELIEVVAELPPHMFKWLHDIYA